MITLNSTVKEYVEETEKIEKEVTNNQKELYKKMSENSLEVQPSNTLTELIDILEFKSSDLKIVEGKGGSCTINSNIETEKSLIVTTDLGYKPKIIVLQFTDGVYSDGDLCSKRSSLVYFTDKSDNLKASYATKSKVSGSLLNWAEISIIEVTENTFTIKLNKDYNSDNTASMCGFNSVDWKTIG